MKGPCESGVSQPQPAFAFVKTPFGTARLESDGNCLIVARFTESGGPSRPDAVLQTAASWLQSYLCRQSAPLPPLVPADTPFRTAVRAELLKVPFGETVSYGALAEAVAKRLGKAHASARAVGGALHNNPLPLFVPCHRVVGSDGSLTGYADGLERKAALLAFEADTKGDLSDAPQSGLPERSEEKTP